MRKPALLLVASIVVLGPASARAATVHDGCVFHADTSDNTCSVTYTAARGEANRLTVRRMPDGRALRLVDRGAVLHAGPGCRRLSAHRARCRDRNFQLILDVALGDGRDRARLVGARPGSFDGTVDGGPGADRLDEAGLDGDVTLAGGVGADVLRGGAVNTSSGGPGDDTLVSGTRPHSFSYAVLEGGAGDDLIRGGPGRDLISGGPGRDRLRGGAGPDLLDGDADDAHRDRPAADRIDGGPGRDTVDYLHHPAGVTVDLAAGTGGSPGETDRLRAVEDVQGTRHHDVLRGDGGPNALGGGIRFSDQAGDELDGRGGDDTLSGTPYDDVLRGGAGDDLVLPNGTPRRHGVATAPADRVSCGPGSDTVGPDDPSEARAPLLPASCERVSVSHVTFTRPAEAAGGLTIDVSFGPQLGGDVQAPGSLELVSRDGASLGTTSWSSTTPTRQTLTIALTDAGRAAVATHAVALVHDEGIEPFDYALTL